MENTSIHNKNILSFYSINVNKYQMITFILILIMALKKSIISLNNHIVLSNILKIITLL